MPAFSSTSRQRLETCDARLQLLFERVVEGYDCTILEGHRSEARQEALFAEGRTQVHWPDSRHNAKPSAAVDVAPYPIDWSDRARFRVFGGYVLGVAAMLGIQLRWGGDWDGDTNLNDQTFDDLVHFELLE